MPSYRRTVTKWFILSLKTSQVYYQLKIYFNLVLCFKLDLLSVVEHLHVVQILGTKNGFTFQQCT